jgi:hypothetical protein
VPKAKFKGVERVRSPDEDRRLSARFISISLKTSKYSLGGALCSCRVQPSPQTRSFPRPSRFDRTTILRCREGLLQRFDRAADPEAERLWSRGGADRLREYLANRVFAFVTTFGPVAQVK